MSFLAPVAGIVGSLGSAAAQIATPGPSTAARGPDYNPVTNINNVGAPDLASVASLVNAVNAGNSANGGFAGILNPTAVFGAQSATSSNNLLIYGILAIVGFFLWRKFGK